MKKKEKKETLPAAWAETPQWPIQLTKPTHFSTLARVFSAMWVLQARDLHHSRRRVWISA
jgi:hypothetical protein